MDREEKIRTRAHEIWENEGRPAGREQEHWERARREFEAEEHDAPAEISHNAESISAVSYDATRDPRTGRPPNPLESQRIARENERKRLRAAQAPDEIDDSDEASDEDNLPTGDDPLHGDPPGFENDSINSDAAPRMTSPSLTEEERQAVEDLVRDGVPPERAEELVETHGSNTETLKSVAWIDETLAGDRDQKTDAKEERFNQS